MEEVVGGGRKVRRAVSRGREAREVLHGTIFGSILV